MILISVAGAVIPAVLLLIHFYRMDRLRPEPKGLILKIFFLGIAFTFLALGMESDVANLEARLPDGVLWNAAFHAYLASAFIEETLKLLVVWLFVYRTVHFDEATDGIIYTITAGLGFACLENILYVLNGGISLAVARAISAVPLHALASGLMGYYIGRAKFASHRISKILLFIVGLTVAVLIHGTYNFLIFALSPINPLYVFLVFPYLFVFYGLLKKQFSTALAGDILFRRAIDDSEWG
ncbi:MAG TPA: PrsW family glutamic-type intramembrane protease [bacterium]|jgi:RsiW-degrading membrane proteinase PrsW (M82 family)|nr:PrsW family glutamic-type intramembrane protease [bacterium]HPG46004.1 PrsW family glutamic-type intramembrane protease [bacterium]HPM97826.1 PrsW family glutamic-type intramembrane protease [bacterium]